MRHLIVILSLLASTLALAESETTTPAELQAGTFVGRYATSHQVLLECYLGMRIKIEKHPTFGPLAFIEDQLMGNCEAYDIAFVEENKRIYLLDEVSRDDCGSYIYQGIVENELGQFKIKMTDHRYRICEEAVDADLAIEEGNLVYYATEYVSNLKFN